MAKLFYGLAVAAVVIAFMDLQAPPGTRAATEGGFLLLLAPMLAGLGVVVGRHMTKRCPHCAERIHRDATKCKHCGSVVT